MAPCSTAQGLRYAREPAISATLSFSAGGKFSCRWSNRSQSFKPPMDANSCQSASALIAFIGGYDQRRLSSTLSYQASEVVCPIGFLNERPRALAHDFLRLLLAEVA